MNKRSITIIWIITVLSFGLAGSINLLIDNSNKTKAQSVITEISELNLDTSIRRDDINFGPAENIVVTPIFPQSGEIDVSSTALLRGIFYYTVDRLGFADIPFHYLVSEDGDVFEGNIGGDERDISVTGFPSNSVIVGYMTEKSASTFDVRSENALTNLLTQIANQNSINPENISVSGVKFVRNTETNSVSMQSSDIFGNWQTGLSEIVSTVSSRYSPVSKQFEVELISVESPEQTAVPGELSEIRINLKNNSAFGMYGGSESELILSKVSEGFSSFFVNNEWLSGSEVSLLGEDGQLRPGEEGTFVVKVLVPLVKNETVSEEFELKTIDGGSVSSERVTLSVKVGDTDKQIAEIQNTETGNLNVRSQPSGAAEVFTQVSPGQRFFITDDSGNGWIQIDLGGGELGWVALQYLTII